MTRAGRAAHLWMGPVRCVALLLLATALAGCTDAGDVPLPDTDDGPDRFGFAARTGFPEGHAVVAVIDTGIDPYHEAFRDEARDWAAAERIHGYPADAGTFTLDLDAATHEAGRATDEARWGALQPGVLYDLPGTRVVGLISLGGPSDVAATAPQLGAGYDTVGHGTASAGMVVQSCARCSLVVVQIGSLSTDDALDWVATQSWIDVVAIPARAGIGFVSSGLYAVDSDADRAWGKANVESGQVVAVASGNGWNPRETDGALTYTPARDISWSYWSSGPDWVVTVGALEPTNQEPTAWHTAPVDLVAPGKDCPAPRAWTKNETTTFEGTSCAAPVAAGWFGHVLAATRAALGDGGTGAMSGQRLVIPADAVSADAVTREDLTRALFLTARRAPADDGAALPVRPGQDPTDLSRWSHPDGQYAPLVGGWGFHDTDSLDDAVHVLLGHAAAPTPDDAEAAWFPADQAMRQTLWGPWDAGESTIPYPAATTLAEHGLPLSLYDGALVDPAGVEAFYDAVTASTDDLLWSSSGVVTAGPFDATKRDDADGFAWPL